MTVAEKLNYLRGTKNEIKEAIKEKGVSVGDTDSFRNYVSKIGQIKTVEEMYSEGSWHPEFDWWDIKTILENDIENYTKKIICLLTDELDDMATTNIVKGATKYKLSDGQVIEHLASTELNITNLFDISKDKICKKGYKTRYIIYYSDSEMDITLPNNVIYTIFSGIEFSNMPFEEKKYLKAIEFINGSKSTKTDINSMFKNCSSLENISGLDTSNVTDVSNLFYGCSAMERIPILDTSKATSISGLFYGCHLLKQINMLDFSEATSNRSIFSGCNLLSNIKNIQSIKISLTISSLELLTRGSILNILNALTDLTGQTSKGLTIGSINLDKLTDEEKAIATEKNWTLA